jgi:hypothetical protein
MVYVSNQQRGLDYYPYMRKTTLAIAFFSFLFSCKKEEVNTANKCNTFATVKDLTGLDGCGFVFELQDGTRLEPIRMGYCGTPPLGEEITQDPLYNFVFEEGKKVKISYEEKPAGSICMVGPTVKITCLEEINSGE